MEESSSTSRKEKKGLGRLWAKVKLAIRSKSKSKPNAPSPTATTTTTTHTTATTADMSKQPPQIPQTAQSMSPSQPETTPSQPPIEASAPAPVDPPQNNMSTPAVQPVPTETIPVRESGAEAQEQPGPSPAPERRIDMPSGPDVRPDEKQELARRYGRAQAIFKKYNMELDEASWDSQPQTQPQIERIYKAPRIRVRWTCHECKTTFGHDKVCAECAHHRCKNCPRYPPKKKKAKAAKMAAFANTMSEPAKDEDAEMQDGVCHECQTSFEIGSEECSNCHHTICDRCLQETLTTAEHSEPQAVEP